MPELKSNRHDGRRDKAKFTPNETRQLAEILADLQDLGRKGDTVDSPDTAAVLSRLSDVVTDVLLRESPLSGLSQPARVVTVEDDITSCVQSKKGLSIVEVSGAAYPVQIRSSSFDTEVTLTSSKAHSPGISEDSQLISVAYGGEVSISPPFSGNPAHIRSIELPGRIDQTAVSATGSRVAAAYRPDGMWTTVLSTIDADNGKELTRVTTGLQGETTALKYSHDGRFLAVGTAATWPGQRNYEIYSLDAAGLPQACVSSGYIGDIRSFDFKDSTILVAQPDSVVEQNLLEKGPVQQVRVPQREVLTACYSAQGEIQVIAKKTSNNSGE